MPPKNHHCAIVLVRTKFGGNLGAVARVMANFGVSDLRLVTPEADRHALEARAMASHGEHLLQQAREYATFLDAISDCTWVAATSARLGGLYRKQNVLSVRDGLRVASEHAQQGKIALVFGPEDRGLLNEEITLCHQLIHIPAHPDYDVLNLAQAAAICLYEWYQATHDSVEELSQRTAVSAGELSRTLDHLEDALREIHFIWGEKGDSVAHAVRHLIARAMPDELENKLLHGLARQVLWYVEHHPPAKMPPRNGEALN